MGQYLCVFDDDKELDGIDVGSYADFNLLRSAVTETLEGGVAGSKYATLILHSDCDGEWGADLCADLERELRSIASAFQNMPPVEFQADWQNSVAKSLGLRPRSFYDSFIDVDGEPLLGRLLTLCQTAREHNQAILFQ
jgi:hypothetical protein